MTKVLVLVPPFESNPNFLSLDCSFFLHPSNTEKLKPNYLIFVLKYLIILLQYL